MIHTMSKYIRAYSVNMRVPTIIFGTLIISQILLFTSPRIGVYATQVAVAGLLLIALLHDPMRKLALSAAILPVVNGCVILFNQQEAIAQTIILYEALFMTSLIYVYILADTEAQIKNELTAKNFVQLLPVVFTAGIVLGTIGAAMPGASDNIDSAVLLPLVGLAMFQAVTEELYFRGLFQKYAQRVVHPLTAVVLTAVVFMLFSAHVFTWQIAIFAFISSCIFSLLYYYKRSLLLTMAMNIATKVAILSIVIADVL